MYYFKIPPCYLDLFYEGTAMVDEHFVRTYFQSDEEEITSYVKSQITYGSNFLNKKIITNNKQSLKGIKEFR
jgi:hypothetical protein